jgi:hypothetical protein
MKHPAWEYFAKDIGSCTIDTIHNNPSFLQTMYCENFVKEEIEYLDEKSGLSSYEMLSIIDEKIPTLKQGNNIHQLYHLVNFLNETLIRPKRITEFGAGYGSFCVRANRLLKLDWYNIIDLPELKHIQTEYLLRNGVEKFQIQTFEEYLPKMQSDLFVALWSLSESPQEIRDYFLHKVKFNQYFFAYGDSFFDLSNHEYFDTFQKVHSDLMWKKIKIPFMENQYYLIGY